MSSDINSFGGFGLGSSDPNSVSGTNAASGSGTSSTASPLTASSIQQSELQALILLMVAGTPVLQAPGTNGNAAATANQASTAVDMAFAQVQHDIITQMWDSYIKNIQKIAEEKKASDLKAETLDANRPKAQSATEYFNYLISVSQLSKTDEINGPNLSTQFTNTYNQWFVTPAASGNNNAIAGASAAAGAAGSYPSSSFLAGSMASNPDAIRNAVGFDGATLGVQLSSSPVADALFAVGPTSGLPGDYQAAAALVAALLNGGAVNKAHAEALGNSQPGKPEYNLSFAVNYAKQVMAIVTKNIGTPDPSDPQRASQTNMMSLMLSAMALNMVYRAAYGGMHSKEFANILAGNTQDVPDAIKGTIDQLANLVNFYLNKNPATKAATLASLSEYVDSKESVDSMLETSNLFTSFLATNDVDANRLAENKG